MGSASGPHCKANLYDFHKWTANHNVLWLSWSRNNNYVYKLIASDAFRIDLCPLGLMPAGSHFRYPQTSVVSYASYVLVDTERIQGLKD